MKHCPCYLCGADEPTLIDRQEWPDTYLSLIDPSLNDTARSIVACTACGFVQRDPKLTPAELTILYEKFRDYGLVTETADQYFDRITSLPPSESENHAKLEWLTPRLRSHFGDVEPESFLDVGCGGGVFLHGVARRFPATRTFGVEPTSAFAQLARRRTEATIVEGTFQRDTFKEKFDVVSAIQVLEHVADPLDFLGTLKDSLSARGVAYIEVPDVADIGHLPPDHDRFLSQHLHIFSAASLREVCRRARLVVVHEDTALTVRNKHNLFVMVQVGEGTEGAWREPAAKLLSLRSRRPPM